MSKNIFNPAETAFRGEIRINIRAEIVKVDPGTGILTLAIEGVLLDRDLQRALEKQFPHCYAEIDAMCAKEALISSYTTEGTLDDK